MLYIETFELAGREGTQTRKDFWNGLAFRGRFRNFRGQSQAETALRLVPPAARAVFPEIKNPRGSIGGDATKDCAGQGNTPAVRLHARKCAGRRGGSRPLGGLECLCSGPFANCSPGVAYISQLLRAEAGSSFRIHISLRRQTQSLKFFRHNDGDYKAR